MCLVRVGRASVLIWTAALVDLDDAWSNTSASGCRQPFDHDSLAFPALDSLAHRHRLLGRQLWTSAFSELSPPPSPSQRRNTDASRVRCVAPWDGGSIVNGVFGDAYLLAQQPSYFHCP